MSLVEVVVVLHQVVYYIAWCLGRTTSLAGDLLSFRGEMGSKSSPKCPMQWQSYYPQSKMPVLRLWHNWFDLFDGWMKTWQYLVNVKHTFSSYFNKQLYFLKLTKIFCLTFFVFFCFGVFVGLDFWGFFLEISTLSSIVKWNVGNFQNKMRNKQEIFNLKIQKQTLSLSLYYSDSIWKYPPHSGGTQKLFQFAFHWISY